MPVPYRSIGARLVLGAVERLTLEPLRDQGPRSYLRERVAMLLAIAAGPPAAASGGYRLRLAGALPPAGTVATCAGSCE